MSRKQPTRSLAGKTVAITGGARGIGLATARALAARGASVAIGDLDVNEAKKAAEELGVQAFAVHLDVSDRNSFQAFLDDVEAALGPLDVLVNNAGIMPLGRLVEEDDEVTRKIVDVNLHGPIIGTKLIAPRMAERGAGHIINVSSGVGRVALAGAATYSATKHGLIGFTEATRAELRDSGVAVSCVVPMIVNTELGAGLSTVRGQRTVQAEEIATTIVKLIGKPRFEAWVPATGRPLYLFMSLLPKDWADALSRKIGAAQVLDRPDRAARDAYEARVRQ
ncbi:SDR family oxidoreductase [Streptomyces sp. NPDC002324]